MWIRAAMLSLALLATGADAKSRKVIDPLDPAIVAAHQVVAVEVVIAPTASETFAKLEKIASEKRVAAGLTPVVDAPVVAVTAEATAAATVTDAPAPVALAAPRAPQDEYATLPFARMFPLVMEDVTREWGLTGGRPVKLKVTVDTLKTANAGMALLFGSADQLAGLVEVTDPATGAKLGSFYIDVINSHGGLAGLAMRGAGIREKLAEEFGLEASRVLTGRKSKTPKAVKS